jgi:hypothetical protein
VVVAIRLARTYERPAHARNAHNEASLSPVAAATRYHPTPRDDLAEHIVSLPSPRLDGPRQASVTRTRVHPAGRRHWSPSLAGIVWLAIGLGLFADGLAITIAPRNYPAGLLLFWIAILGPFVPFATVLVAAQPSPALREFTVAAIGVYPAIIYRMTSPLVAGGYDEHLHERTLLDLLHGSGLFAPNPLLQVSPYYPGMELFTGVAVRLTGLPVMLAMSLVVLLCRFLLILTIYHTALTVFPSRRAASLVVIFYAASPQFYYFDAQFAYETMALTLGLGGLFLLRRAQLSDGPIARRLSRLATLALLATVVAHHVTSWLVLGFLVAWTMVTPRAQRQVLARAAVVMAISVAIWTATLATRLEGYLGPVFGAAFQESESVLGRGGQGQLFNDSAGTASPQWERVCLIVYALVCTGAALVCGWILLRKAFRDRNGRLGLIGILDLVYPVTLAAHYVGAAAELGDRASTFLSFSVALSCALVARSYLRAVLPVAHRRHSAFIVALIGVAIIAFLGGVLLGSGPDWERLPGPYLVSAEARTQDPETLAAVRWAAMHLPAGSRVVADRIPAALLASQARMWPVYVPQNGLEPAWLYFSDTWGPAQTAIVRGLHIRYIYVDQRLADSLPHVGFYFYNGESPQPRRISNEALTKFSHVPGLKVVYRHGPVAIYDTSGLGVIQEQNVFTGNRPMGLGTVWDALWGALTAALVLILFRRVRVATAARSIGGIGIGTTVISVTIFVGGVLFGLRLVPGPAFTVGALLTAAVNLAVQRCQAGLRFVPRIRFPDTLDLLVLLGIDLCISGLAIGLYAAWTVDVTAVDAILRSVG